MAVALLLFYALGLHRHLSLQALGESRDALLALVSARPVLAPAAFVAIYTLAVACSFPAAAVLTISGGFLFGWLWGGALSVLGATAGATALFLAGRTAFGEGLRRKAGGWAAAWGESFRANAFSALLVLRLVPFIPFFVVNIIPAIFGVTTRVFVAATFLGIIPGAFINAWLGQGLDSVLIAARAAGRDPELADLITPEITVALLGLAGLAGFAATAKRLWGRKPA
jgi:uncharacterized membrane protein YdjX (TVP38/TMEM64 family)